MELSRQVCSLELAKRLKELGVRQESLFYWSENIRGEWSLNCPTRDRKSHCSAFNVAELGEMLPILTLTYKTKNKAWKCIETLKPLVSSQEDETEANARAKMLIYLIENKLIEVPK